MSFDAKGAWRASCSRHSTAFFRGGAMLPYLIESVRQDLGYTVRSFCHRPGFFASATVLLALAIGVNTAVVSLVRTVLLDALPYPDSSRLVMIWQAAPLGADDGVG